MTRFRMTCAVTIAVLAGLAVHMTAGAPQSQEKTSVPKVRVGTFDSRALAMAYYSSEAFNRQMDKMRAELNDGPFEARRASEFVDGMLLSQSSAQGHTHVYRKSARSNGTGFNPQQPDAVHSAELLELSSAVETYSNWRQLLG